MIKKRRLLETADFSDEEKRLCWSASLAMRICMHGNNFLGINVS